MSAQLIERVQTEADQCRNDGADDIARLLDEVAAALAAVEAQPVSAWGRADGMKAITADEKEAWADAGQPDVVEDYTVPLYAAPVAQPVAVPQGWQGLKSVGAQMANLCFDWAQRPGHVLTSDDVALLDKLRRQWGDAKQAAAPAAPAVQPPVRVFLDHQIAHIVNGLTGIAKEHGASEQLRHHIREFIEPVLACVHTAGPAAPAVQAQFVPTARVAVAQDCGPKKYVLLSAEGYQLPEGTLLYRLAHGITGPAA